ncbi:Hypothetical predicted protein, partial [Paramuricea clavata]
LEVLKRLSLANGFQKTLTTFSEESYAIKLDCTKKRVYWLANTAEIISSDYDGKDKKTIANGSFTESILGVFGDSLYYQNTNLHGIKEMNVSTGNISRSILVDKVFYDDLIFVDNSAQPI